MVTTRWLTAKHCLAVLCFYSKTGWWPSYCQISTDLDKILHTPIVVRNTLVGGRLRPRSAHGRLQAKPKWLLFSLILVTNPKSYIETTDSRDFGGKPSKWRWGRVLSWKIPEIYSVGGAEPDPKNSIFRVFRVHFDCPAHSLQETVLHQTNGTCGKPRLWRCAFC